MNPLKLFFNCLARIAEGLRAEEAFASDPFDHPEIAAMDLRQLADLPLPGLPLASRETEQTMQFLARCA